MYECQKHEELRNKFNKIYANTSTLNEDLNKWINNKKTYCHRLQESILRCYFLSNWCIDSVNVKSKSQQVLFGFGSNWQSDSKMCVEKKKT